MKILSLILSFSLSALAAPVGSVAESSSAKGAFADIEKYPINYAIANFKAVKECSSLLNAKLENGATITKAIDIKANDKHPDFCLIEGIIPQEILFQISLPKNWNKRLYMFGNGGFAGENLNSASRLKTRNRALNKGFIVVQQNTGHDASREPLSSFAKSYNKIIDYAYLGVHKSVALAKNLAKEFYDRDVTYSYWDACSTGGRQGMMSAHRYPSDFDGIVAGAPVSNFVDSTAYNFWVTKWLLNSGMTLEKTNLIAKEVIRKCDHKDGVTDGTISLPYECDFDPLKDMSLCKDGKDDADCITKAQAEAMNKLYEGIILSNGEKYFYGMPRGMSVKGKSTQGDEEVPGFSRWILSDDNKEGRLYLYAEAFMKGMAQLKWMPEYNAKKFNFDTFYQDSFASREIFNTTEPNLEAFKNRGGKMIMYHGLADQALNPMMSISYFEKLKDIDEKFSQYYQLYLIPGMFHCRGGNNVDTFDAMSAIINWVEADIRPTKLDAVMNRQGKITRTRPICPHPQRAVYIGSGDINDGDNFKCE